MRTPTQQERTADQVIDLVYDSCPKCQQRVIAEVLRERTHFVCRCHWCLKTWAFARKEGM